MTARDPLQTGSTDSDLEQSPAPKKMRAEVLLRAPKDQNGNPDKQQRIQELPKCSQVLVDDILSWCIKIIKDVH